MVDSLTGETEEGMAVREIKKLGKRNSRYFTLRIVTHDHSSDPNFIKEEWAEEVRTKVAPVVIKAHLAGDLKALKPWLGEAVFNKLAADIRIVSQGTALLSVKR